MIDQLDSSDSTLRLILWKALQRYPTSELLSLLLDEDPIVRTSAAKQLHFRANPEVFRRVRALCSHKRNDVREVAAFVLGQLGTPQLPYRTKATPILLRLLQQDSSSDVMGAAAAALGHLSSDEATDLLLRAAGSPNPTVKACAAFALGRISPSDRIKRVLARLAKNRNAEVRSWARLSLGLVRDKER